MNIFNNSNNVIIVNGQIIGKGGTGKFQKYDERKSFDVANIQRLTVDSSFVDVDILATESTKIDVHFFGKADVDGELKFDVQVSNGELKVMIKSYGSCYNAELKLDILLPLKMFKNISIQTMSADITLSDKVSCDKLKLKSTSGDLETSATFKVANLSTMSGDIDITARANEDIVIDASAVSGDICLMLSNISNMVISTHSVSGNVRNTYKYNKGFFAEIDLSTTSGDIRIR